MFGKETRSYNEVYEACLVGFAVTGTGRHVGLPHIVILCNGTAERETRGPRSEPLTRFQDVYETCLLEYAQFGAPRGVDLEKSCTALATGVTSQPPPDTTRHPR